MQVIQEFSSEITVRDFSRSFWHKNFEPTLIEHFRKYVPSVYSGAMGMDAQKEERKARKVLFRPMEYFLCGGDPEPVLEGLQRQDAPAQLCGRVFKNGEPTYSCRECGADPTCVLCSNCFSRSAHKQHRYKVTTSNGGGYCDCGDVEAWRTHPACEQHKAGTDWDDLAVQGCEPEIPEGMRERCEALFRACAQYCMQMLTWEDRLKLPDHLTPDVDTERHVCMLFNDEVHTYDQVITTLQRAVQCNQEAAVEFATVVDREGRSVVKDGSFSQCDAIREAIEKRTQKMGNKPLKCSAMHCSVYAHQIFAQKMLVWLQSIINRADFIRRVFCSVILQPPGGAAGGSSAPGGATCPTPPALGGASSSSAARGGAGGSVLEHMLLSDTRLWKSARVQSQQLFMSGVMKDLEMKKSFAILFTQLYPRLMKDFVTDDHEHSVSAMAQSVQLFTVPTLARMLIAEHNLLQVILEAFLHECDAKVNSAGVFELDDGDGSDEFERASEVALQDAEYALIGRPQPNEWTDALRKNFLNGFVWLLKLLQKMQGMDAVTRQTGKHIEFEPEWEGAFNIQLKLSDVISNILMWLSTDKAVTVDAFVATVDCLYENRNREKGIVVIKKTLAGHTVDCIQYDVSSEPVSVHLPLSRMLAGIYQQLSLHGVDMAELQKLRPWGPRELMEPSLCCVVMVAQTVAQMWRRNGYALINQIYFYHNVRCRRQMADKDLVLLQAAAALLPPDGFLVHVLNRFGLMNWCREDYDEPREVPETPEESTRHIISLAEEFFTLLIQLLGERYQVGVGQVTLREEVRREVVHQLCLQSMSHSELTKALPEDTNGETGLEDVIDEVAVFSKPSGSSGKGMYELKAEGYSMFTHYFYHYAKHEFSKAEETQRKRLKGENTQALVPPESPPCMPGFQAITRLMDCDVMLYLMKLILKRTAATRSKSWSEAQLEQVLYLIGMSLLEERRGIQNEAPGTIRFTERACVGDVTIPGLLGNLVGHNNVMHEGQRDLLAWVIKTFSQVQLLRSENGGVRRAEAALVRDTVGEKAAQAMEKQKRAQMAAKRRQKILAQMASMQKVFIEENKELFEETKTESTSDRVSLDSGLSQSSECEFPVALGAEKSAATYTAHLRHTCILCQEEQDTSHSGRALVLAAFIQRSTVLSRHRGASIPDPEIWDPLFAPASLIQGAHTSSCGHVMHYDCWQRFHDAVVARERRRHLRRARTSYDVDKQEFLCPLCETLANTVLPLVPQLTTLIPTTSPQITAAKTEGSATLPGLVNPTFQMETDVTDSVLTIEEWLDGMQKTVRVSVRQAQDKQSEDDLWTFVPCPLSSITKLMAETAAHNFQLLYDYVYDDLSDSFSVSVTEMARKFTKDIYSIGLDVVPDDDNVRVPVMTWCSCAYTIMSTEHVLRSEGKPLFGALPGRQTESLGALIRFAAVSNHVIQQDVVKRHCVTLLSGLLCDLEEARLQVTPCLLEVDMFHLLVELVFSLPVLYAEDVKSEGATTTACRLRNLPRGSQADLFTLQLTLAAHLVQILLTTEVPNDAPEGVAMETDDAESQELLRLFTSLRKRAGNMPDTPPLPWQLRQHVHATILPFLRCAGLLFHFVTGVRAPDRLYETTDHQYELLCRYLSLPKDLTEIFKHSTILSKLVNSWSGHPDVRHQLSIIDPQRPRFSLYQNQLISLPAEYTELINTVSTFTCPKSNGDESRAPTLCLVCGAMLCSQSYCCQIQQPGLSIGAATAHAQTCGAGVCLFLRVRECQILLLSGKRKGSFYPPPYLDDYGETDQGLKRGNPLHLCSERYAQLQRLWRIHALPEEIAHHQEANTSLSNIEWHHL